MKKISISYKVFFLILTSLVFLFSLIFISDYVNADGYVHINQRICQAQQNYNTFQYTYTYYKLFIFLSDLFSIDACNFFKNNYFASDFYDRFSFNELNYFNTGFRINYPKLIISLSFFFLLLILIILINHRFIDDLVVLTSPTIFFGLMSISTDSMVIFFTFFFYLIYKKVNTSSSYLILIPGYFFTDRSYIVTILYPILEKLYLKIQKLFKLNPYIFFILTIICTFTLAKIIILLSPYYPQLLKLIFPPSINTDIANTINKGNFPIFGFFISLFSTPNLVLVNIFQILFFLYLFFKQKLFKKLKSESLFVCAIIFIFFSTLIGGISMSRHYIIVVLVFLYFLLENCNLFQRKIIFLINIFYNLFALIYYFNKGLL